MLINIFLRFSFEKINKTKSTKHSNVQTIMRVLIYPNVKAVDSKDALKRECAYVVTCFFIQIINSFIWWNIFKYLFCWKWKAKTKTIKSIDKRRANELNKENFDYQLELITNQKNTQCIIDNYNTNQNVFNLFISN
jgi:hypothetical protein